MSPRVVVSCCDPCCSSLLGVARVSDDMRVVVWADVAFMSQSEAAPLPEHRASFTNMGAVLSTCSRWRLPQIACLSSSDVESDMSLGSFRSSGVDFASLDLESVRVASPTWPPGSRRYRIQDFARVQFGLPLSIEALPIAISLADSESPNEAFWGIVLGGPAHSLGGVSVDEDEDADLGAVVEDTGDRPWRRRNGVGRLHAPQLRRPLDSGGVSIESSSLGWTVDSWSSSTGGVTSGASDV